MFNWIRPFALSLSACLLSSIFLVAETRGEEMETIALLDPSIAEAMDRAAKEPEPGLFEGRVRAALASYPRQKQAILRHAMTLRPDWAAALIAKSLAQTPETAGHQVTGLAAAGSLPTEPAPDKEEPLPTKAKPPPAFTGSIDFGGILRTGNTENGGVKGQLKLTYKSDRWQHKGTAEAGYLKSRTDTLEQKLELEYETNYDIRDNLFAFGLGNYTDDRFSGFDYEILTAAGLGVRLFDEGPLKWEVTAGPSLRYAEISESDESETSPGARFTNDIAWQISDNAFLGNETEVLWDRERVTVDNDTSLKMRIVDQLSGKISFNTRYRSNVPDDTENTDTTTRASIVYDF